MMVDYQMKNRVTDHGLLGSIAEGIIEGMEVAFVRGVRAHGGGI